ncbi:MAG TPA: tRNA uracil 4-sulfurtransferase ThiI [Nitrososphaerales archaeon]|nr:tRNA uracil 4-sulfurtransferase ThiI [Nitrososphaerales archaeon]
MPSTYVVHFAEVALKGKNRPEFVRALRKNLRRALSGLEPDVRHSEGRLMVTAEGPAEEVARRIGSTFGVAWFSQAELVESDLGKIRSKVLEMAGVSTGRSFKIDARRSDKSFPLRSQEIAASLGADVAGRTGMKVDLSNPEVVFHVDVTKARTVVYSERQAGPGGLPVGTAGRVMVLFSGGIDSPVAAWLMMKRGCMPVYVHFYLAPSSLAALDSKITRLVKVLSSYGGKSTVVLVPFAEYQLATAGGAGGLEPSLFRRFMRMTCEALAPWFGASAIATGDSLSQAASQTLWNIGSFDHGSTLPILRPLLTFDKEEIIRMARKVSTYDLSLEEYKDCCAIITRHPRTRVKVDAISDAVANLELAKLVWKVIDRATLVTYNPATDELKSAPLADAMRRGKAAAPPRPAASLS